MAMLQGDLRDKRNALDTGTGIKRLSDTGREEHIGRGTYINWQDDLGISSTESAATDTRASEAEFASDIAARYKALEAPAAELATATEAVNANKSTLAASQAEYDSGITQYNKDLAALKEYRGYVKGKSGAEIQQEYANEHPNTDWAANILSKPSYLYGDEEGHWIRQGTGEGSSAYTKALYDTGGSDKDAIQAAFRNSLAQMDANKQTLAQALASIATGQDTIDIDEQGIASQQGLLTGANSVIKGYEDVHQDSWDEIHSNYAAKQERMKAILGGLNFG